MGAELPSDEALFEHAACGLLLTDADGLILRANATVRAWLGYEEAELAGKLRMPDLLPVGARLFFHTHCLPMLQVQGAVTEIQIDLRHRRGERRPVLVNIVRKQQQGQTVDHWAVFASADRHAYERELLAARQTAEAALEAHRGAEARLQSLNAQLSAADHRKDEFLATLSHELRNPLAPMRTALDILRHRAGQGTDRLLQAFDRQLRHLTRLVDDLMEVARITQGRMQLRRAPVDLVPLAQGAAQDLADAMRAARHTLRLDIAASPLPVDGDATRLSQVILNLLNNAIKYTPDGGTIELHVSGGDGFAEIRVSDSGIGIPASSLESVFEMFSQLEPALDRAKGGLGIGLALVRGIVELHGGSIHAASAGPGLGSEFTVRLPLLAGMPPSARAAAGQPPAAAPNANAADTEGMRVLVVDDNLDAAEALAMALRMFGCDTRLAHTAQAALALAPGFRPQTALLDIGLPDLNGYELARRMRTLPGGAGLTLIATTGWGQDKDRQRAFEAGFDHHLTKPVDVEQLRRLLARKPEPSSP